MWQRKILYQGNSCGIFQYDAFLLAMIKHQRLPLDNTPLYRMDIFVIEPNVSLFYTARKRLVPRGLDLWTVTVALSGYAVEEVEKNLVALISEQKS